VSATPSVRARKAQWKETRLVLVLASAQHCLEGAALLNSIVGLLEGYSYRQMAALAGRAYQDVITTHIPDWPFDGDSPFQDAQP
jgi:hypothetical protein